MIKKWFKLYKKNDIKLEHFKNIEKERINVDILLLKPWLNQKP